MTYHGRVKDRVVVLDEPLNLPEGTAVEIIVAGAETFLNEAEGPSLFDTIQPLIGVIKDLPDDFARNHDHYIHGTPKR